jgi:chemotaxis signal transduction protein
MRESYLALPLSSVVEITRPLPVQALPGVPRSVLGACVMRGAAVPVIDANQLFDAGPVAATRFVALRAGEDRIVLAVESVLAPRVLPERAAQAVPQLLSGAQLCLRLGALDRRVLVVLDAVRLVSAELLTGWEAHASTA